MLDTIFALSSGAPPAAIGVLRISGPKAGRAIEVLGGSSLPEPRRASLRTLHGDNGEVLDSALVLWFPGPDTATGEDLLELHCHGGRAVVARIEQALEAVEGMRRAEPGEFTRRSFANGRIDLAEAEALADLLSAETELQRQAAQAGVGGALSSRVDGWREAVLRLGAQVEAALDFSDEDDVEELPLVFHVELSALVDEIEAWLKQPGAERLRDGVRVVLGGPPNSGKSTLFNALVQDAAAIISPIAGTTRDIIERPVALGGVPFLLVDTAGLREAGDDRIEAIGVERAREQFDKADIVLWLGPEGEGPQDAIEVQARADEEGVEAKSDPDYIVSAVTGRGMAELERALIARARDLLPKPNRVALNRRQRERLRDAVSALGGIDEDMDLLILGEKLRLARAAFDGLLGRASTEDMLDALFGRFCIGK